MKKIVMLLFSFLVLLGCTKKKNIVPVEMETWLEQEAEKQIMGCRVTGFDSTTLYTPDGEGNYKGMWTRDFGYMVENAFHLIPNGDVKNAIVYLLNGRRADGCIPDRVRADGLAIYSAGPVDNPLGDPPSDNTQFMVKLVAEYVKNTQDIEFFKSCSKKLDAAMDYVPRSVDGLVYIDPRFPHSPYGFTDTIQKTGELLFSSLLYWEACWELTALYKQTGDKQMVSEYGKRAKTIEKSLEKLWDKDSGMFYAATIDCRQIDIWGNAYAVYIGFPLGDKKSRIVDFLYNNREKYIMNGQIRHLTEPETWKKTLIPVKPGTYQNGAYWGTASGWIAFALLEKYPEQSSKILTDLISDYQQRGPYECINVDYVKINNYVASAVNPLGVIKKIKNKNSSF